MIGRIGHKCTVFGLDLIVGTSDVLNFYSVGHLSAPPACYFLVITHSGTGTTSFVGHSEI